jgi:hypothetical protein
MRTLVATMLLCASVVVAAAQTPQANPGKDSQNATGRTPIPEKIGRPLERGLTSWDVRLRNATPRLQHGNGPSKSRSTPTR